MGCNCGKKAQQFKDLVKQAQVPFQATSHISSTSPSQPIPPPMTRAERIRLRAERITKRNEGVEARRIAREARIKARQHAAQSK